MDAREWSDILSRVPVELQEAVVLGTTAGPEVALESIVRVSDTYVLARGRLAGTTESGRLYLLPFDRILYMVFSQPAGDARLTELFGPLVRTSETTLSAALELPEHPEEAPGPTPTPTPDKQPVASTGVASAVRDRLRSRLAAQKAAEEKPAEKPGERQTAGATPAAASLKPEMPTEAKQAAIASLRERLRARLPQTNADKPKQD